MKEKLTELLTDVKAKGFWEYGTDRNTGEIGGHDMTAEDIADYLLENGVTVQEWIPVTERLPKYCENVLAYYEDGTQRAMPYIYTDRFPKLLSGDVGRMFVEVTHWMPLPEPPNGERRTDAETD